MPSMNAGRNDGTRIPELGDRERSGASSNGSKIRVLELMTYEQKLRHWGDEENPWRPEVGRYRFSRPSLGEFRVSMVGGDITSMPKLLGRPCFGILTAYLRFRDAVKWVPRAGMQPATRCGKCPVSTQCADVVKRRINYVPELKRCHDDWLLADGSREIVKTGWRDRRSGVLWRRMCKVALAHPCKSKNDVRVAEHYADKDQSQREADRARQARKREQARRAGAIDHGHERDIERAMLGRAATVVQAINDARKNDYPRALSRMPSESLKEMLEVWLGRELLRARQQKPTAAAIARWVVANKKSNSSANENALAVRVSKDLKRITAFEKMSWNGAILLPPFNQSTEFSRHC